MSDDLLGIVDVVIDAAPQTTTVEGFGVGLLLAKNALTPGPT